MYMDLRSEPDDVNAAYMYSFPTQLNSANYVDQQRSAIRASAPQDTTVSTSGIHRNMDGCCSCCIVTVSVSSSLLFCKCGQLLK